MTYRRPKRPRRCTSRPPRAGASPCSLVTIKLQAMTASRTRYAASAAADRPSSLLWCHRRSPRTTRGALGLLSSAGGDQGWRGEERPGRDPVGSRPFLGRLRVVVNAVGLVADVVCQQAGDVVHVAPAAARTRPRRAGPPPGAAPRRESTCQFTLDDVGTAVSEESVIVNIT